MAKRTMKLPAEVILKKNEIRERVLSFTNYYITAFIIFDRVIGYIDFEYGLLLRLLN